MDAREFEARFLDFVYRTDALITPGALAYHAKCTIEEAQTQLDRLTSVGTVTLDSDDDGNLYYVYPNRESLKAAQGNASSTGRGAFRQPGGSSYALQPATPSDPDATKRCEYCGEKILVIARKCKHCGEVFDLSLQRSVMQPRNVLVTTPVHNPGVAAVLSFLWPGAGQMYCGKIGAGLGWMFGVVLGYMCLVIPGLALHIACIFSAAGTAKKSLPPGV